MLLNELKNKHSVHCFFLTFRLYSPDHFHLKGWGTKPKRREDTKIQLVNRSFVMMTQREAAAGYMYFRPEIIRVLTLVKISKAGGSTTFPVKSSNVSKKNSVLVCFFRLILYLLSKPFHRSHKVQMLTKGVFEQSLKSWTYLASLHHQNM